MCKSWLKIKWLVGWFLFVMAIKKLVLLSSDTIPQYNMASTAEMCVLVGTILLCLCIPVSTDIMAHTSQQPVTIEVAGTTYASTKYWTPRDIHPSVSLRPWLYGSDPFMAGLWKNLCASGVMFWLPNQLNDVSVNRQVTSPVSYSILEEDQPSRVWTDTPNVHVFHENPNSYPIVMSRIVIAGGTAVGAKEWYTHLMAMLSVYKDMKTINIEAEKTMDCDGHVLMLWDGIRNVIDGANGHIPLKGRSSTISKASAELMCPMYSWEVVDTASKRVYAEDVRTTWNLPKALCFETPRTQKAHFFFLERHVIGHTPIMVTQYMYMYGAYNGCMQCVSMQRDRCMEFGKNCDMMDDARYRYEATTNSLCITGFAHDRFNSSMFSCGNNAGYVDSCVGHPACQWVTTRSRSSSNARSYENGGIMYCYDNPLTVLVEINEIRQRQCLCESNGVLTAGKESVNYYTNDSDAAMDAIAYTCNVIPIDLSTVDTRFPLPPLYPTDCPAGNCTPNTFSQEEIAKGQVDAAVRQLYSWKRPSASEMIVGSELARHVTAWQMAALQRSLNIAYETHHIFDTAKFAGLEKAFVIAINSLFLSRLQTFTVKEMPALQTRRDIGQLAGNPAQRRLNERLLSMISDTYDKDAAIWLANNRCQFAGCLPPTVGVVRTTPQPTLTTRRPQPPNQHTPSCDPNTVCVSVVRSLEIDLEKECSQRITFSTAQCSLTNSNLQQNVTNCARDKNTCESTLNECKTARSDDERVCDEEKERGMSLCRQRCVNEKNVLEDHLRNDCDYRLRQCQNQCDAARRDYETKCEDDKSSLRDRISDLEDRLVVEQASHANELVRLNKQFNETIENLTATWTNMFQNVTTKHRAEIDDLTRQLQQSGNVSSNCSRDLLNTTSRLMVCDADLSSTTINLDVCALSLRDCQHDLANATAELSDCTSLLNTCTNTSAQGHGNYQQCQRDLNTTRTSLATCSVDQQRLTTFLDACDNNLTSCYDSLSNTTNEHILCTDSLTDTRNDLTVCLDNAANLTDTLDAREKALNDSVGDMTTCNIALTVCNQTLTTITRDLMDCDADLTVTTNNLTAVDSALSVCTNEYNDALDNLTTTLTNLSRCGDDYNTVRDSFVKCNSTLNGLVGQLVVLGQQKDRAVKDVLDCNKNLGDCNRRAQTTVNDLHFALSERDTCRAEVADCRNDTTDLQTTLKEAKMNVTDVSDQAGRLWLIFNTTQALYHETVDTCMKMRASCGLACRRQGMGECDALYMRNSDIVAAMIDTEMTLMSWRAHDMPNTTILFATAAFPITIPAVFPHPDGSPFHN